MTETDTSTRQAYTPSFPDIPHGAEDRFIVSGNGYQPDPMLTAITRAQAILLLLSCQFVDEDMSRISDRKMCDVICAIRGELGILERLVEHGMATSPKHEDRPQ